MPAVPAPRSVAGDRPEPLSAAELRQLSWLRRLGTTGALLIAIASISSYGAATPFPNPVDGMRILGLMSRIGPASLAVSYTGIGMVVIAWFFLGRLTVPGRRRRLTRTQLSHTLAMWAVPLVVTPPIFSRDVYSYLALGRMMNLGLDPYELGPWDALGDTDTFAHQVDARWQHTATPYGPVFLLIVRGIMAVTGQNLVPAILLQRVVELAGVALIVWAVPRLARRCGLDPVAALWLGAANPLVLFHLVAGGHNEALMIGLMMAGLVIALDRSLVLGTVLLTLAVGIKATAGLALAFLVIALALRAGGRWRDFWRSAFAVGAVFLVTMAVATVAGGVGLGWVAALNTPGMVLSFMSVTTVLGVITGVIGQLLGLGDHTGAALGITNVLGTAAGGLFALWMMWRCWRHRFDPILGLGVAIGVFVLLSPVVQPWYLLWATVPLAASTALASYRKAAVWLTCLLSVMIMPTGANVAPLTIIQAVVAAGVVLGPTLYLAQRRGLLPSRLRGLPRKDGPGDDRPIATDHTVAPGASTATPPASGPYPGSL